MKVYFSEDFVDIAFYFNVIEFSVPHSGSNGNSAMSFGISAELGLTYTQLELRIYFIRIPQGYLGGSWRQVLRV